MASVTTSLLAGALCGLGTVAVSEWLLWRWASRLKMSAISLSLAGLGARTVWVLTCLAVGLSYGLFEPKWFVASLLAVYFAGLLFEAGRYQGFIQRQ